jgi:hypothetical protein
LSIIWFAGSGVLFLLIVAESAIGSVYQGQLSELWGWFLPTVMPTLSLILSVMGAGAVEPPSPAQPIKEALVRSDFYAISYWLTWMYLVLILATILAQPAARYAWGEDQKAVEVLKTSSLWLTPVQSLVVVAIGVLFFTRRDGD